ncbi:MAG: hypothetical protein RIS59_416 [Pseudomonadota bacterium]
MDMMQANLPAGGQPLHLHRAISAIYSAIETPEQWRSVAEELAKLFNADAVVLCQSEGDTLRVLGDGLYNLSPENAARLPLSYSTYGQMVAPQNSGTNLARVVDDVRFTRSIDSLPPGARVLTVVIPETDHTEPRHSTHLSLAHSDGRLPFSDSQQDLRLTISQHLTEAIRIQRRFARRQQTADFHSIAILHLGEAWLVIDRDMALIDCNPLARSFLMRSDIMRLQDGMVRIPNRDMAAQLQVAMDSAWGGERFQVSISSVEDNGQVGFEFHPFFPGHTRSSDAPSALMVLVRELDRDLMLKIEAKAEACNLSRAERRVMVHLVRSGQPPAAIAAAIGTSERTVRCQLSSIFRKTGARNQQDLIRMTLMV